MKLFDTENSYGWVSIILHWLTAVLVITMWIIGNSINSKSISDPIYLRNLHISIGLVGYMIITFRIYWRIRNDHPKIIGQKKIIHRISKIIHYSMLILISSLLISGPLIIAGSESSFKFMNTISIHNPFYKVINTSKLAYQIHFYSGVCLALLITLHITAAFRHMMFYEDETFARILRPRKGVRDKSQDS